MFGTATLYLPRIGDIGPLKTEGLSDALALTLGRTAVCTLLDHNECVVVRLESGKVRVLRRNHYET